MFVLYSSGDGNVTVSPRLGAGHVMPQFNSDAQISVLEGTGVQARRLPPRKHQMRYLPELGKRRVYDGDRFVK